MKDGGRRIWIKDGGFGSRMEDLEHPPEYERTLLPRSLELGEVLIKHDALVLLGHDQLEGDDEDLQGDQSHPEEQTQEDARRIR